MAITIKLRRDTAANWTSVDPVLALGEAGIETDTRKWKVGDGSTAWTSLDYMLGGGGVRAGTATLAAGEVTVEADWVTANTVIVVTPQAPPDTPGTALYVDPTNIIEGESFDISSDDSSDARSVFWIATEPSTAPPSGFALKADTTSVESYVTKDLGSDQSEAWLTFEVGFTQAARDFWDIGGSGVFAGFQDGSNNLLCGPDLNGALHWTDQGFGGGEGSNSAPSVLTFHLCELHFMTPFYNTELYVDGSLIYSTTSGGSSDPIRKIVVGQFFANPGANSIAYIKNVKVGTTRGGNDLFQDDFSSEDLSNWDSATGTCSVVNSPF